MKAESRLVDLLLLQIEDKRINENSNLDKEEYRLKTLCHLINTI